MFVFLQVAVDEDDLRDGLPITSKSTVETYLEKHAFYFQEIVLQGSLFFLLYNFCSKKYYYIVQGFFWLIL